MSNPLIKSILGAATLAAALICGSIAAAAAAPAMGHPQMTKEQREKMAQIHEQMAQCLRSDRTIAECHAEMMKGCEAALGAEVCAMMGPHHRMHRNRGMMPAPDSAPTQP